MLTPRTIASGRRAEVTEMTRDTNPRRLLVAVSNVAQAITIAGGWLIDHALAGWDVALLVPEYAPRDDVPAKILGASLVWMPDRIDLLNGQSSGIAVAIEPVKGLADGAEQPMVVSHRPSRAALAFKLHSLRALHRASYAADLTEEFECIFSAPAATSHRCDSTFRAGFSWPAS